MKIESKFDLNETVWEISREMKKRFERCKFCDGEGKIELNNISRTCPECYGRNGSWINVNLEWLVGQQSLTIGSVRVEITSISKTGIFDNIGEYDPENIEREFTYMAYETGIGTGTIHREHELFKSIDLAQKRCDELNAVTEESKEE